ncbi:MAG: sigma-70 family RNA polymerase sigma factor [Ignavibacteria bacterium]|nr:sigma-70 family RNA polymerase sigma factor [Ignavibacteria bacterium]
MALPQQTDQEIIHEYCNGDQNRAATVFVRKYQKFVYSVALRYLRSHDDADDASQEVFINALRNVHSFRGESTIQTWLYRITINVCTSISRKRKFVSFFKRDDGSEIELASDVYTPQQQFENKDFEKNFHKMLAQLPDKQRETFILRYFDELSYEEISQMIGTSVGGLKANYFQAVQKLAKLLKNSEYMKQ